MLDSNYQLGVPRCICHARQVTSPAYSASGPRRFVTSRLRLYLSTFPLLLAPGSCCEQNDGFGFLPHERCKWVKCKWANMAQCSVKRPAVHVVLPLGLALASRRRRAAVHSSTASRLECARVVRRAERSFLFVTSCIRFTALYDYDVEINVVGENDHQNRSSEEELQLESRWNVARKAAGPRLALVLVAISPVYRYIVRPFPLRRGAQCAAGPGRRAAHLLPICTLRLWSVASLACPHCHNAHMLQRHTSSAPHTPAE